MNATQLFVALLAVLAGLFLLALIKPYVFGQKTITIQTLKDELAKQLPHHDLTIKQGTQSRIIISLNGTQKAIVIMNTKKPEYVMGGLPIFTTNRIDDVQHIAQKVAQRDVILN